MAIFKETSDKYWQGGREKRTFVVLVNVNWFIQHDEQYGVSSKKLKIELPYNPAIPFESLPIENKHTKSKRNMHSSVH